MSNKKLEIIDYIKNKGIVSAHELINSLGIGPSMIHRHLKSLIEKGILIKQGIPPKVYYSIAIKLKEDIRNQIDSSIDKDSRKVIEENFLLLTPDGKEISGVQGFIEWCNDRNYSIEPKAKEYSKLLEEYNKFKKDNAIDATLKVNTTFKKEEIFLDSLYYLHPYSIPIFGKTKIAQWLFHAKQTQNKMLIKKVLDSIVPEIMDFIKKIRPEAVAFVPPTVPRNIQFMKELQKSLHITMPHIVIEKIKTPIMIQQKSLKNVKDRVKNAESTMVVRGNNQKYRKILVIDDFTGSGSTLNIIAKKLKIQNLGEEIIGVTITGSMKGFDVIREV